MRVKVNFTPSNLEETVSVSTRRRRRSRCLGLVARTCAREASLGCARSVCIFNSNVITVTVWMILTGIHLVHVSALTKSARILRSSVGEEEVARSSATKDLPKCKSGRLTGWGQPLHRVQACIQRFCGQFSHWQEPRRYV